MTGDHDALLARLKPLLTGDAKPDGVLAFFSGMAEEDRRRLAPSVAALIKSSNSAANWQAFFDKDAEALSYTCCCVALAATATAAEMEKVKRWTPSRAFCVAVAERARPWLPQAFELALDRMQWSGAIGDMALCIHDYVRRGLCPPPTHERYPLGVVFGYGNFRRKDGGPTLSQEIIRDLNSLEPVIWRLFEVEGGGEISLATLDKYRKHGEPLDMALKTVSDAGHLDRGRLLDASLDALNRGFSQFRVGWFSRFHELIEPTLEERAARADRYLDLLASPIGPTVSLAMNALKKIQKAGRLDADLLAQRIEPALYSRTAATAKGALALLEQAGKSRPGSRGANARLAAAALEHPASDVQDAALRLIESYGDGLDAEALAARREGLAAPLRPRLDALLKATRDEPPVAAPLSDAADMIARAKTLPADPRRRAGVDAALQALERKTTDIARADFTGMDIPRLDPARAVAPIENFEEFIGDALRALETSGDLDLVERVLAGALRFSATRPDDAARLLGPLGKSLKRPAPARWARPRGALQMVLSAYFDAELIAFAVHEQDPRAAIVERSQAMARAIRARAAATQFSAPTHRGAWIDPLVLVERAALASPGAPSLGLSDQILALLRLAPDHRAEALEAARNIAGEWGAALRYALGGSEPIGKTAALWIAAARARAPFEDDPKVRGLLAESTLGGDLAPRFSWSTRPRDGGWVELFLHAGDPVGMGVNFGKEGLGGKHLPAPTAPIDEARCLATVAMSDPGLLCLLDTYVGGDGTHATSWAAAMWPQNPEPLFALAAKSACLLDGANYMRPSNEPLAEGFKTILDPDAPLGPMALLMLCRGLNAIDKAAAAAAVDAMIALIDDGRLDGEIFGATLHEFLHRGLVFPKRWPDRVREIARSSPLALMVMARAFERSLRAHEFGMEPRDLNAWLETCLELCVEAGRAVEDPAARVGIDTRALVGKAKATGKALLALAPGKAAALAHAAAVHALRQRLARAERWRARL